MYAIGILGLTHEDLWHVSLGQLYDRIYAHKYKIYCDRVEAAIHASYGAALNNSTKKLTIEDLVGRWEDGLILSANEFLKDGRIITKEEHDEDILTKQRERVR